MASDLALADVRASLAAERDELEAQLARLGHGAVAGDHYDPNFADSSQVTAERGENEALVTKLVEALNEVEHALGKFDNGGYGVCEACGKEIASARLEARPEARLCIDCAAKAASRR